MVRDGVGWSGDVGESDTSGESKGDDDVTKGESANVEA